MRPCGGLTAGGHRERDVGHHELNRLRGIALSFPGINERLSHGEPCFFVRDRRPLCYFHDDHNGDGRISMWCPTPPELQEELITAEPERFFKPPTSARGVFSGWLGIYLDLPGYGQVEWKKSEHCSKKPFALQRPRASSLNLIGDSEAAVTDSASATSVVSRSVAQRGPAGEPLCYRPSPPWLATGVGTGDSSTTSPPSSLPCGF